MQTKLRVFILTYLAFAMNHACRMSLAYNKPNIKYSFGLTPIHLGILDATVYIAYGLGSFLRYFIFGERHFTKLYLISAVFISFFFASIPCMCIFAEDQLAQHIINGRSLIWFDIAITVSMAGYGFSHLATWQIVLALMSQHWNSKKQGSQMGFWTSMSCIGNILAFLVSNYMIISLNFRWQTTMLLFAILNLFVALVMYVIIQDSQQEQTGQQYNPSNQKLSLKEENKNVDNITSSQCFKFNKNKFFGSWDFRLFILISTCLKVLNYSFLFWYPSYLYVQGFGNISGYIAMLFDISSIFGSYIVGKMMMYDKVTCRIFCADQSQSNLFLKFLTVLFKLRNVIMMLFSVGMVYLFLRHFGSLTANILITIVLGLTIGGIFHVNATFNSMALGQHKPRNVDMISNFSTAFGTIILGLFQLVIGIIINTHIPLNATQQQIKQLRVQNYRNLFYFLIIMMWVTACLMLLRSKVLVMMFSKEKPQQPKQITMLDFGMTGKNINKG